MLDLPLLVPAIRLDKDDGGEETRALRRAAEPWVAGFLLFGGEVEQVRQLTTRLRQAAGRPIFIASDMERGAGQQVEGLSLLPCAGLLGYAATPDEIHAIGEWTAWQALGAGVDVIMGPCLDVRSAVSNPILGCRSFGYDPDRVAFCAGAFAVGLQVAGATPVYKHFPGHGATTEDSHDAVPVVHASASVLQERDLAIYDRVLDGGVPCAIMTAHVAYPALDPTGTIATFSAPILERARRIVRRTGPEPLTIFTDALLMAGAHVEGGEPEAARRALVAGCDAMLYPADPEAVAAGLGREAGIPRSVLETAAARIARFTEHVIRGSGAGRRDVSEHERHASALARRALALSGLNAGVPSMDGVVVIDDDDMEGRGTVLMEQAARHGRVGEVVRVPRGEEPALEPIGRDLPGCPNRAIVVFASARAWKGSPGARPACISLVEATRRRIEAAHEDATVIWCGPRRESRPAEHLPGTGPHLEAALAAVLFPEEDNGRPFLRRIAEESPPS